MQKKEKNHNPTGKNLFALYVCNNCKNADSSLVPKNMGGNIPFFIKCSCGSFKTFYGAFDTHPFTPAEVMTSIMVGETKFIDMIFNNEFKNYGDVLAPDGTMDRDTLPTIDIDFGPNGEIDPLLLKPKKEYKKRENPTSAKQVCPICGNEFIIKDVELFLEVTNEAWEMVRKGNPEAFSKQLESEIYRKNSPDNIKKEIEKKGYFTGFCQPCMSRLAWSLQLKMGI